MESLLVPLSEASMLLGGLSRPTLYRMFERGELHRVNVGRRAFIRRSDIDEFVSSLGEVETRTN